MSGRSPVEQAIAALRRGERVRIAGQAFAAVETAPEAVAEDARLLVSGARAAALGLANEREAADPGAPVLLGRPDWLTGEVALQLVDPAHDFERAPIGPLHPETIGQVEVARAALRLARRAGLLPALWWLDEASGGEELSLAEASAPSAVTLVARAALPLEGLPPSQMVAFRDRATGEEHVALLVGAFAGKPPLVRLHSECLTGDVFGSLKCDCGPQLHVALKLLGAEGGGVLLYLRQEGRGIGLANKLRAYALQDRGLDTVDSNRRLGFADDERDYGLAAAMLKALGIGAVRLLTNNPNKLAGLEEAGIEVVERVAHHMPTNPHNADYLAVKRERSGHLE